MEYKTRKMVKGADLNGSGNLFGGTALSWIDEEAAIYALCQLNVANVVTKAISNIDFRAPARMGDLVEIGCSVVKIGTTSITVKASMRNKTTQMEILTIDSIVFVAVDPNGEKIAHGRA